MQIFSIVLRPVSSPLFSFARTHHSKCSLKNKVRALWEQLDFISGLLLPLIEGRCVISVRAWGRLAVYDTATVPDLFYNTELEERKTRGLGQQWLPHSTIKGEHSCTHRIWSAEIWAWAQILSPARSLKSCHKTSVQVFELPADGHCNEEPWSRCIAPLVGFKKDSCSGISTVARSPHTGTKRFCRLGLPSQFKCHFTARLQAYAS